MIANLNQTKNYATFFLGTLLTVALGLVVSTAQAQEAGTTEGPLPRRIENPARIVPVLGTSSFITSNSQRFNQGNRFAGGLFADFGKDWWGF